MDQKPRMQQEIKPIGKYDIMIKLLIIGDSAVGKTCLLQKFCDNIYTDNHIATIGIDFKIKTIEVEGKKIKMQIWDTAGQEKFKSIVQTYYKGAMGIIIVYACNDRKSFLNVENWMKQIKQNSSPDIVILLVGNKCDILERQVEANEGLKLANKYGIKFYETSAKEGIQVNQAFLTVAKEIKDKVGEDPNFDKKPDQTQNIKLKPENTGNDSNNLKIQEKGIGDNNGNYSGYTNNDSNLYQNDKKNASKCSC